MRSSSCATARSEAGHWHRSGVERREIGVVGAHRVEPRAGEGAFLLDIPAGDARRLCRREQRRPVEHALPRNGGPLLESVIGQIGRAAWRGEVCREVYILVVAGSFKKKKKSKKIPE